MKNIFTISCLAFLSFAVNAQNFPEQWRVDEENHTITIGGLPGNGLFNANNIDTIYLQFQNNNWQQTLMMNQFMGGDDLSATLTYHGVQYPQVGVSYKGFTSFLGAMQDEKKSFNITMDAFVADQKLEGYDVINLNNSFDDPTFMREFTYLSAINSYIPAAKACYAELVINGVSWGLYPMVQQLDGRFIKDWFLSKDGSRWRAFVSPFDNMGPGGGGPGGPGGGEPGGWGDGTAALNYLGASVASYEEYYTLKSSTVDNPWQNLINTADILNNTPIEDLPDILPSVLDIDRTLWFLACENVFADDDSYIMKGTMDYYLYWEIETGRMVPIEFDGNTVLLEDNLEWGPFYNADNPNYPLLNKLLSIPDYRQRYLAHMRTIINEQVDAILNENTIAAWKTILDTHVQNDQKKLYTYNEFVSGATELHNNLQTRRNLLMNDSEVNQVSPIINSVQMASEDGIWASPDAYEVANITSSAEALDGIYTMNLYYSYSSVGNFSKIEMFDDGNHNDQTSGDGIYGASIPGVIGGSLVRFYVEAVRNNEAKTVAFMPAGAEHDVFYYRVNAAWASSTDIVINEIMADNGSTAYDEAGDNDDWIELYNRGNSPVDLSGYFITDNDWSLNKWEIPAGTILNPNQYLILWADEQGSQGMYHTNFKLAKAGETLTLVNGSNEILDQLIYTEQTEDVGLARIPNGTGPFVQHLPTFNANNDTGVDVEEVVTNSITAYPNPCSDVLFIQSPEKITSVELFDMNGRMVFSQTATRTLDVSRIAQGVYVVKVKSESGSEIVTRIQKS